MCKRILSTGIVTSSATLLFSKALRALYCLFRRQHLSYDFLLALENFLVSLEDPSRIQTRYTSPLRHADGAVSLLAALGLTHARLSTETLAVLEVYIHLVNNKIFESSRQIPISSLVSSSRLIRSLILSFHKYLQRTISLTTASLTDLDLSWSLIGVHGAEVCPVPVVG